MVGVAVVGGRDERLLDGAGRRPAQQVERRAGLVVGAGRPGAAERLLPDDGTGRLVVDVEVAGGEPQRVGGLSIAAAVVGDHRTGQRVRRARVDQGEDVGERVRRRVVVDVHREDRTEVLGA